MIAADARRVVHALVRSRLVHFFGAAAVLMAIAPASRDERGVLVDRARVERALDGERARLARPLSDAEKQAVMATLVRDELLAREARRLGLGEDDEVVRARLADRMRAHLAAASAAAPTEEELSAEAAALAARAPARVVVELRFVARDHADAAARADALSRELARDPDAQGGDRPPLPQGVPWLADDLARVAGASVARAAVETPIGSWSAPVASTWGFYLVRPTARRAPEPAELREAALSSLRRRAGDAAVSRFVDRAARDYRVTVQAPPGEPAYAPGPTAGEPEGAL